MHLLDLLHFDMLLLMDHKKYLDMLMVVANLYNLNMLIDCC